MASTVSARSGFTVPSFGSTEAIQRANRKAAFDRAMERAYVEGLNFNLAFNMKEIFRVVMAQTNGELQSAMSDFAKVYSGLLKQSGPSFRRMWEDVGQEANRATYAKYTKRPTGRQGSKNNYRASAPGQWKRYSGGKLAAALRSPEMYLASTTGIAYINVRHLDKAARQWKRLNFGAGPAGAKGKRPQAKPITVLGQNAGSLSLARIPVRPGFMLPAGWWMAGDPDSEGGFFSDRKVKASRASRGRDVLYPSGYAKYQVRDKKALAEKFPQFQKYPSRGIAAQGWLDAGVGRIAELGPAFTMNIIAEFADEALNNFESASARTFAKAGVNTAGSKRILDAAEKNVFLLSTQRGIDLAGRGRRRTAGYNPR